MTLFNDLTPEATKLIEENSNLINKHLYDWIQAEKKITGGITGEVLRYIALAKRRKNHDQHSLKITLGRKNLIEALVRQGNTMEEFKKVIDYKIFVWWDTDQRMYLTPETLFRQSNFQKFLEEATEKGQLIKITQPRIHRMGQE